jgi:hypothetical protein
MLTLGHLPQELVRGACREESEQGRISRHRRGNRPGEIEDVKELQDRRTTALAESRRAESRSSRKGMNHAASSGAEYYTRPRLNTLARRN